MKQEPEKNDEEIDKKIKLPQDFDIDFQKWMLNNSYSIKTIKDYHHHMINLVKGNNYITIGIIKSFLNSKNYSVPKRSAVKLFLLFLEDSYNIKVGYFRYPRISKKTNALEVINIEQFNKIINNIEPFLKMYAKLMYYGGLRVSEVVKINVEDFNWNYWVEHKEDYGELKIINSKRNKDRIIPIKPKLMKEIYEFSNKHETGALKKGRLFDYSYTKTNGVIRNHQKYVRKKVLKNKVSEEKANRMYNDKVIRLFQRRLSDVAYKTIGKRIKTHVLRSSRATHLDEKGMQPSSIQYFLGHDNLATTSRYIINNPEKLKKEIKKID